VETSVSRERGGLQLNDVQIRDHTKVTRISGHDRVAKIERRCSDEQVLEWYLHSLCLLLAVDPSGQQAGLTREGIHGHIRQQFFDENFPLFRLCGVSAR
jgi:hypothetical protein